MITIDRRSADKNVDASAFRFLSGCFSTGNKCICTPWIRIKGVKVSNKWLITGCIFHSESIVGHSAAEIINSAEEL
ncbi:MAG: hypothetical protein PHS47_00775 [Methanocellales archaeon]|nr:hypothetical protein [Methanocellales archaeon]MDD4897942.1 hypothetical protein [Methanocellales archaeon]MDD5446362.1 hypothetical protein [Methanocellales archaeon]